MASPLEQALVLLVGGSPDLKPDDLGAAIVEAGELLGGREVTVLLGDIEQRTMRPIAGGPEQAIDGTAAGTAFRNESAVIEAVTGGERLWVPILDSAERLGVIGAVLDQVTEDDERSWSLLASLVGELVVTKTRYGDHLALTRRTRDVSLAAELRWSLLPPLTFTAPDVLIAGMLEPAYDIAGDSFDYAVNGVVAHVGLFDAMGHGLEACRMANLAVGSYQHGRRTGADLVATARAADDVLHAEFGEASFVTGQLAALDLPTGELTVLNAGHPAPSVFHADGTVEVLPVTSSPPLGIESVPRTTTTAQLRAGDLVLFHTDGITEARSASGDYFGDERLRVLVRRLIDERLRPAEIIRQVILAVIEHDTPLRDDATLVLLGWRLGPRAVAPAARV